MEQPAQAICSKVANFSILLVLECPSYGVYRLALALRDQCERRQFSEVGQHLIFSAMEALSLRVRLDSLLELVVPRT